MADNMLEHFHLREREYYMPYQLSGDQQQRVAIARSLIANPSIILADEPTGNLDSRSSHIIMEELQDIHSLGNTIIMVTHNPALTTYATRVINMLDGEIDTDIKTVADQDLPKPGDPEKISVRILSKKRPVQLEVDSKTTVLVSGNNVAISQPEEKIEVIKPTTTSKSEQKTSQTKKEKAKSNSKKRDTKKTAKVKNTRSRVNNIIDKAKTKVKSKSKKKEKES